MRIAPHRARTAAGGAALWLAAGLVLAFLMVPILAIVPLSFNDGQFLTYPLRGVSLRWYEEFFTDGRWLAALRNSIMIGLTATLIATPLGVLAAIGLALVDFPGRRFASAAILTPMIVPIVIYAVGLYFVFSPLGLTASFTGLILAHAALGAPFVVVTVGASLANFDWALMRAAASLGAGPLTTARRVMLPLIAPGVLFGALLAFAASLEEVVVVLIVGGPAQRTLPREMFVQLREHISPTLAAAAALLMLMSAALLVAVEVLRRRNQRLRSAAARQA
jgi:putative spermidine/putrescine transport system permease protein